MTPKQRKLHAYLVKVCHTLKKNKFSDDECRKDYLRSRFEKDSFKELSIEELKEVAKFLGYFIKPFAVTKGKVSGESKDATTAQVKTINGIWFRIAKVKTELALRQFIDRITKRGIVLYIEDLTRSQAQDVINALLRMQESFKENKNGNIK